MRKLLLKLAAVLIVLFYAQVAQATPITVQSTQISNWYGGSSVEVRIYLDRAFLTSDNKTLQSGSPASGKVYQKVTCSVVGTTLTINSFTIDSTTDGLDIKTAKYSAYFFNTSTNQQIQPYQGFEAFAIPFVFDTGTTTSWAGIRRYNAAIIPIPQDLSTYSRTEIDSKFANVQGLTNPMTTLGDIITGNSGGAPMRLGGNITTQTQFLTSTGTGSAATTPSYQPLSLGLITGGLGYTPVNKAGDTMTGALTLSGAPTQNLHAATKLYVDTMMGGMGTISSINGSSAATQTFTVNTSTFPTLTITDNAGDHKFGLSAPIGVGQGGTGLASYTAGDIPYSTGSTTISKLAIGANNTVLKSNGTAPVYGLVDLTANVSGTLPPSNGGTASAFVAFTGANSSVKTYTLPNADTTILTTNAAVTAIQGGTGFSSYTVGQILYADTTTTLAKLNIGGANTVLHGGTTPSYSAVDIVNDTTGTLTVAKGGSGGTSFTSGAYLKGAGTSAFTVQTTPLPIADLIASPVTNAVVYNASGALAATNAGTTGTVLIGTTGSAPSFSAAPVVTSIALSGLTQGSIPFVGAAGLISQNNARLAWDDTNFRLNVKGTFRLLGSNAGQTGFIAPATVTGGGGTVIYVLPAADGTNGQALVTDGAGNLSWTTLSGGGGGGGGITSLNGLTASIQTLTITTTGANSPSITQPTSSQNQIIIPLAGNSVTAGLVSNASQTLYGAKSLNDTLSLRSGTTTDAPLIFNCSSCSVLTTPVAGAFETNGTNLFYTNSSATRKTISFTDTTINDSQLSANVQLKSEKDQNNGYAGLNSSGFVPLTRGGLGIGLTIGASGTFLRSDGSTVGFSTDGSALTSLNASNISSGTLSNSRLSGVQLTSEKGSANGYASLDSSTKVPVGQISEVLSPSDLTGVTNSSGSGATIILSTITAPADAQYLAYNGVTNNWENRTLPSGTSHTLLDGVTVTDSINTTVTRGAIVVGNSTPKWTKLSLGSPDQSLTSNGTDAVWAFVNINAGTTGTLAATRGGTGLTAGTSGGLVYFDSTTSIASSSRITHNSSGDLTIAPAVRTTGSPNLLTITGPVHTTLTASTEASDVLLGLNRTVQFATGALADQRAVYVRRPTYGFVGASTITRGVTLAVEGAPVAGTNASITQNYAFRTESGDVAFNNPASGPYLLFQTASGNLLVRGGGGIFGGSINSDGAIALGGGTIALNVSSPYSGNIQLNNFGGGTLGFIYSDVLSARTSNATLSNVVDPGVTFTNTGAAGTVTLTLPASPALGNKYRFVITTNQTFTITANTSQTIRNGGSVSASAGNISSNTVGNVVEIEYVGTNTWYVMYIIGTWTLT